MTNVEDWEKLPWKDRNRKQRLLGLVEDLVGSFTYYDRKEDEEFRRGDIEEMVKSGEITIDEIVDYFRKKLEIDCR